MTEKRLMDIETWAKPEYYGDALLESALRLVQECATEIRRCWMEMAEQAENLKTTAKLLGDELRRPDRG